MPAGIVGSVNAPGTDSFVKVLSNISTLPLWKSAAYSVLAPALLAMVSPVYSAAPAPSSCTVTAWVGRTFGDHAAIVPASVAHMNTALEVAPFAVIEKSGVLLNSMPVGLASLPLAAGGIVTT